MKLSKNLGRIATTFLATAMLASLTAVPAFAADEDTTTATDLTGGIATDSENGIKSIVLDKTLYKRADVHTPKVTFDIDITALTEEQVAGETIPGAGSATSIPVSAGEQDAIKSNTDFTFVASADDVNVGKNYATTTATVVFDPSAFTAPGVYKYSVTEKATSVEGITNDSDNYYLYLYVEEAGLVSDGADGQKMSYKITNVVLTHTNPMEKENKVDGFTNYYGVKPDPENPDPDGTVNDLILTKNVTGKQGDRTKKFAFNITVSQNNDEFYDVYYVTYDQESGTWKKGDKAGTITPESGVTVDLADGESVRVYGLSASDTYQISETDANKDGYTTKADNAALMIDTNNDSINDAVSGNITVNPENKLTEKTVTFENHKEAATPTGIVMNVAPYALLVVVAAAGCFVFMRKRRED